MTRAEILDCLTDRPCDVCRFHESERCERWDCVFEEKPDDVEADAISRISVLDTLDNTDEFMDEERTVETYKALLKECYEVLPSVTPKVAGCDDAISRQAALDELKELDDQDLYLPFHFKQILDDLPSVTPRQKAGHWIDYQKNRWIYAQCSECGTVHDTKTNYCPDCGAKMAESEG